MDSAGQPPWERDHPLSEGPAFPPSRAFAAPAAEPGENRGAASVAGPSIIAPVVAVLALLLAVVALAALRDEREGTPWNLSLPVVGEPDAATTTTSTAEAAPAPLASAVNLSPEWSVRVLGSEQRSAVGAKGYQATVVRVVLTNRSATPAPLRTPILGLLLLVPSAHAGVPAHQVASPSAVVPGQGQVGNGPLVSDELSTAVTVPAGTTVTGSLVYLGPTALAGDAVLWVTGNFGGLSDQRLAIR
jgi:hypothetical protein